MSQALLRRRMALLDELRQIVNAMRNMSIAALQHLGKAAQVEKESEQLLLQALADTGIKLPEPTGTGICLVIGSEHGFCGGFNDRLADFMKNFLAENPSMTCYIAGSRLSPLLVSDIKHFVVLKGCADMMEAVDTVSGWMDELLIDREVFSPLTVIYQDEEGVKVRRLLPLPILPEASPGVPPLRYLPDRSLQAGLLSEWLRLALLSSLTRSLTIEHRWRISQMQRAEQYLDETGLQLRGTMQRQRQNEITIELENLMSALESATGK